MPNIPREVVEVLCHEQQSFLEVLEILNGSEGFVFLMVVGVGVCFRYAPRALVINSSVLLTEVENVVR